MANAAEVLRLRVDLQHIEPPIWRLIEVPSTYTFWDLHVALQDAMGWLDCHLHAFRVRDPESGEIEEIGIPTGDAFAGEPQPLAGWEMDVREYLTEPGATAWYEYDFGDGWEHKVVLEEIAQRAKGVRYPRCLEGARACPPEDCGGPPGYEDVVAILADPAHEEYEETREWLGGDYDPEAFDPRAVRFSNPKQRWKKAFQEP